MHEHSELGMEGTSTGGVLRDGHGRDHGNGSRMAAPSPVAANSSGSGSEAMVVHGSLAGEVTLQRSPNRYERYVKPVMDRVGAMVILVLLAPVLAVISLAVRITMGRGVIFSQQRIGRGGRRFTVYKFRTMRPDRRRNTGMAYEGVERRRSHKSPDHPLVTPLGRVLRQLGLDELPQLWNVVLGDMSLVGPRPELPWIVAGYQDWQHRRHEVKPGLTGLWQVTARGSSVMHERTDVDLAYLDRVRFRTDLWLMLRTVAVLLRREGSF